MTNNLFDKVLNAISINDKFIEATNKNILYVHFGSDQARNYTFRGSYFATEEFFSNLNNSLNKPDAFNPYRLALAVLFQEISQANIKVEVIPKPGLEQEPYISFSKILTQCLDSKFSAQKKFLRHYLLELLTRSLMILFFDFHKVHPLTVNDFCVGDPSIANLEEQPFVVRITRISPLHLRFLLEDKRANKENINKLLEQIDPFEKVKVFDVFSKATNQRVLFSPGGSILWEDEFPVPFQYPFALIRDSVDENAYYSLPLISKQQKLVDRHIELNKSIDKSTHSIARPLLVYDAEARIDDQALKMQLMEGNKNILLGKSAAGDIKYISPGVLPQYVYTLSAYYDSQLKSELGISPFQLGLTTGGIREAGAIQTMLRSANRTLAYYANIISQGFEDLANYILNYYRSSRFAFMDELKLDEPSSIKFKEAGFLAFCSLVPSTASTSLQEQMFAMRKWQSGLISHKTSLEEMGYKYPDKIISDIKKEKEEFESQKKQLSISDQIRLRCVKVIHYEPEIIDVYDKFVVKVKPKDLDIVKFLLADFENQVLIVPFSEKVEEVKIIKELESAKETKGESETAEETEAEETEEETTEIKKPLSSLEALKKVISFKKLPFVSKKELKAGSIHSPKGFSITLLGRLIERSKKGIKAEAVGKYVQKYPGLYLVEPHALRISKGEKLLILKSRLYDIKDRPHILAGDYLYGLIIPRFIWKLKPKEFEKLQKYHTITPEERKKWWGDQELYGYMFEFHRFEKPVEYVKKPGVQNFIKAPIEIRSEKIGVPYTGDLKPVPIKPWKVPPPAKPEKKAFAPYEFFSVERISKTIPEGRYNVSEKIDGVRCFIWKVGDEAKAFSDEGNEFDSKRIKPILDSVLQLFKGDVLLDGELAMVGKVHQDVAGYVHGKFEPSKEDLDSIRYYCFDILYLNGKQLADKPFIDRLNILNLFIKPGQAINKIIRVKNINVDRDEIPKIIKKIASTEGVVVREINSAYWATHLMFKCKFLSEIDVKVLAVEKTKTGLPIFHCVLKDGTYMGQTYAQAEVFAKPGDIIRVQTDHFTLRPDGSIGWFAPRTSSIKGEVKKHPSLLQPGIKEPDTLMFIKEKVLADGLPIEKWNSWYPKHLEWKKKKMPNLIKRIMEKVRKGVSASKT